MTGTAAKVQGVPKTGGPKADGAKAEVGATDSMRPTKLFIGGITRHTTTKQLHDHFSKFGRVLDCVAMRQADGRPRGFGYVTLDSPAAAERCLSEPQVIDERVVDLKYAVPEGSAGSKEASLSGLHYPQELGAWPGDNTRPVPPGIYTGWPEAAAMGYGTPTSAWWPEPVPPTQGEGLDCVDILSAGRRNVAPLSALNAMPSHSTSILDLFASPSVPISPASSAHTIFSSPAGAAALGMLSATAPEFVPFGVPGAATPTGILSTAPPTPTMSSGPPTPSGMLSTAPPSAPGLLVSAMPPPPREAAPELQALTAAAEKKSANARKVLGEIGNVKSKDDGNKDKEPVKDVTKLTIDTDIDDQDNEVVVKKPAPLEDFVIAEDKDETMLEEVKVPTSECVVEKQPKLEDERNEETEVSVVVDKEDKAEAKLPAKGSSNSRLQIETEGLEVSDVAAIEEVQLDEVSKLILSPSESEQAIADEDLPSIGSAAHASGECKRCNFFPKGRCQSGKNCEFCHFDHEKRKSSRQEKRERRAAWLAAQEMQSTDDGRSVDEEKDMNEVAAAVLNMQPVLPTVPPPLQPPRNLSTFYAQPLPSAFYDYDVENEDAQQTIEYSVLPGMPPIRVPMLPAPLPLPGTVSPQAPQHYPVPPPGLLHPTVEEPVQPDEEVMPPTPNGVGYYGATMMSPLYSTSVPVAAPSRHAVAPLHTLGHQVLATSPASTPHSSKIMCTIATQTVEEYQCPGCFAKSGEKHEHQRSREELLKLRSGVSGHLLADNGTSVEFRTKILGKDR